MTKAGQHSMKKLAIALVGYAMLVAPVAAADFEGMARVMDADKLLAIRPARLAGFAIWRSAPSSRTRN